ncbi:hypothetical protein AAFF_G00354080 [Aldrovandia affinis]|uniref:Uncharacterized protein n=1 Tax=Aldrovandia affinis TaxID=143900 RepID=A0AAD7SKI1_9TELE|nr:hypothetical protein AAFF_G00354080 [Aldrovandia affinis]
MTRSDPQVLPPSPDAITEPRDGAPRQAPVSLREPAQRRASLPLLLSLQPPAPPRQPRVAMAKHRVCTKRSHSPSLNLQLPITTS